MHHLKLQHQQNLKDIQDEHEAKAKKWETLMEAQRSEYLK